MITYDNYGSYFFLNLCKLRGSVFPKALWIAVPSTAVSTIFVYFLRTTAVLEHFKEEDSVMNNNAIWGGFSFAVGFLVIFRTGQAYSRFWEGCTSMHKMGAEWYDACAALMAFTKHSDRPMHEVMKFQNLLIRLFSMLHSIACGEIAESGMGYEQISTRIGAFDMELIDAQCFSDECLLAVQNCDAKTELIMQWIQQYICESIKTGILSIPPPILSRAFQEIATGMVHFNDAMKIANVPFPFPYAQTCDMLLVLHWFAVPFVVSQWVVKWWWAAIFSFIMVFTLWTLNFIAIELENPFGCDANDIDGQRMQKDMNNHLRVLIREETWRTPTLIYPLKSDEDQELMEQEELRARAIAADDHDCIESFHTLWSAIHMAAVACNSQATLVMETSYKNLPVARYRAVVDPNHEAKSRLSKRNAKDTAQKRSQRRRTTNHGTDNEAVRATGSEILVSLPHRHSDGHRSASMNGVGKLENAEHSQIVSFGMPAPPLIKLPEERDLQDTRQKGVDQVQGHRMTSTLLGRCDQNCWDAYVSPRPLDTSFLSQEDPALLPRVLSQNIIVTPPGRGQHTVVSDDAMRPPVQRANVNGVARPSSLRSPKLPRGSSTPEGQGISPGCAQLPRSSANDRPSSQGPHSGLPVPDQRQLTLPSPSPERPGS